MAGAIPIPVMSVYERIKVNMALKGPFYQAGPFPSSMIEGMNKHRLGNDTGGHNDEE
jgi:hypothetical protein